MPHFRFKRDIMVFKQLKSSKILLLSASVLGAGLLFTSLSPSAFAQDAGGQDSGESLPEEVQPEPLETEPAPEEVTPEAGETDTSSSTSVETNAEPGSFACANNPNPACEEAERDVAESWASENNPGPDYAEPPRLGATPLEPGSWACSNNQNVVSCENPIRYTVEDKDAWPSRFPPAGQRVSGE